MSQVFFEELQIPEPQLNLKVGSGSHGRQTGDMLIKIEEILISEKPDVLLVYGDTNSTLAGALAAAKMQIPIAHVEAGLRSFNKAMPEEHNRVLTDHCSNILLCPTDASVNNLNNEGIYEGVHKVGDVMYDSVLFNTELAKAQSRILDELNLESKSYALATIHRAENTDNVKKLKSIFFALEKVSSNGLTIIAPLHPRTQKVIQELDIGMTYTKIIDPVSYLDMLMLEKGAKSILTDSGGVQKEAYWFRVPCLTLRDETEWIELVEAGWNTIVGADSEKIVRTLSKLNPGLDNLELYGSGNAAGLVIDAVISEL
jgi:UDP-N-acetylglucosamine 2-epimerase